MWFSLSLGTFRGRALRGRGMRPSKLHANCSQNAVTFAGSSNHMALPSSDQSSRSTMMEVDTLGSGGRRPNLTCEESGDCRRSSGDNLDDFVLPIHKCCRARAGSGLRIHELLQESLFPLGGPAHRADWAERADDQRGARRSRMARDREEVTGRRRGRVFGDRRDLAILSEGPDSGRKRANRTRISSGRMWTLWAPAYWSLGARLGVFPWNLRAQSNS
jgi:hypothetical protein